MSPCYPPIRTEKIATNESLPCIELEMAFAAHEVVKPRASARANVVLDVKAVDGSRVVVNERGDGS